MSDQKTKCICIVQVTRLGDLLQTMQACEGLKENLPHLKLKLVAREKFAKPLDFLLRKVFDEIYYLNFKEAFAKEKCVVIFPSGKLAKKIDGVLTEQDWMPTVVSLARKHKAPVQPLNLKATNSWLYYFFSNVNGELRDITLFHELLNKRGSSFEMTFGPLIGPDRFEGDASAITLALREYVSTHLAAGPETPFSH